MYAARIRRLLTALALSLTAALVAHAGTITVPGDFATIQEAMDAALDGDLVLVSPGLYEESIDFLGKAITVQSTDGPGATTIDANQFGSVVTLTLRRVSTLRTSTTMAPSPLSWTP